MHHPQAAPRRDDPPAVAYICNFYPAISNTFILSEVTRLRRLVGDVQVFSVRKPPPAHLLDPVSESEHDRTVYILPAGLTALIAAHVRSALWRPAAYTGALRRALQLRRPGWRGAVWQLFYFAEAMILADHCRRRRIRHLHAHFTDVASELALLVSDYFASTHTPVSWSLTVHGPVDFYQVEMKRIPDKIRSAEAVVCISDFTRSQLMAFSDERDWTKLRVIHCGIELERFRRHPRSRFSGHRAPRVLTVGRFVQLKGHAVLLKAIAILATRGEPVEATLIGYGPKDGELKRLARELGIENLVHFPGAVGHDHIPEYLAEADVFVLPSFAEGVPISLMEAMAMETPVVSTRLMGIPELVDDGENGLLVRPGRSDELADAISRLTNSTELCERLGRAARDKVEREFDVANSASALAGMYSELGLTARTWDGHSQDAMHGRKSPREGTVGARWSLSRKAKRSLEPRVAQRFARRYISPR